MRGYLCPGCGRYIGLMCDSDKPGRYVCPHTTASMIRTGMLTHGPQTPIKRDTPKKPVTPL
jgi:hypothetical protein